MTEDRQIERASTAVARAFAQLIEVVMSQNKHAPLEARARSSNDFMATVQEGDLNGVGIDRRIYVYLAGSRGCANLARSYGSQIMAALNLDSAPYVIKCGTTSSALAMRLRQIGQDRYGAAIRTENGIEIEPGFTAWIAHTITTSREPRDAAIKLRPRVISVDLPKGLTRRGFDGKLHRALKGRALNNVPGTVVPRRYVAYELVETRISAAAEFYAMSPHESATGDLLLDAIEMILAEARAKSA